MFKSAVRVCFLLRRCVREPLIGVASVEVMGALVVVIVLLVATVCIMGWKLRQTRQRAAKVDTGGISDDNAASAHSDMHTWPEPTAAEECQQLKSVE